MNTNSSLYVVSSEHYQILPAFQSSVNEDVHHILKCTSNNTKFKGLRDARKGNMDDEKKKLIPLEGIYQNTFHRGARYLIASCQIKKKANEEGYLSRSSNL